jgi:hypothetical protein
MKTLKYEGDPSQRVPELGRGARFDPRVSGKDLQPEAAALGARLPGSRSSSSETCKPTRMPLGDRFLFMSFPRHPEIYPPMETQTNAVGAPVHRLDELPAGYSWAGYAPAEPASASPAAIEYAIKSSCWSSSFQRTANSVLTVCVRSGGKRKSFLVVPGMRGSDCRNR